MKRRKISLENSRCSIYDANNDGILCSYAVSLGFSGVGLSISEIATVGRCLMIKAPYGLSKT